MQVRDFLNTNRILRVRAGQKPKGEVVVSGAKNSAIKLMAAAILSEDTTRISNFPTELVDALYKADFLRNIGVDVSFSSKERFAEISARSLHSDPLDHYNYPIRTTYLLVAAQWIRNGIARIPYPGGCKIGNRKYDLHVDLWQKMGAKVIERKDHIEVSGAQPFCVDISFPFLSVGATENALLCASVAKGTSVIRNAYISPEVEDLIHMLQLMGAKISCEGNSKIEIEGVTHLRGVSYKVMPDRIEALTWIVYGILAGGELIVHEVPFSVMQVPLIHLQETGIDLFHNSSSVFVSPICLKRGEIQPFEISTGTYPGVISDMQPFFVMLALKASGTSSIIDYRYPERTTYLSELSKTCPGAINWNNLGHITIKGPVDFRPANMRSTDLRGSMATLLGALLASEGESSVSDINMALRGYNRLLEKLMELGIQYEQFIE